MSTKFNRWVTLLGAALWLAPAIAKAESDEFAERARRPLSCDVAIIGGGAGGLHTAFRLAPTLHGNVCVFEKEDRLGGRIYDVSRTPGGPVTGMGARRIMEGQTVVFALADELGITHQSGPWKDDLITTRGQFDFGSDALNVSAFPKLDDAESETTLYDKLRFGPERKNAVRYPDFRSYSIREYGNRIGAFRVMETLDRHGIRATAAIDGFTAVHRPAIVSAMFQRLKKPCATTTDRNLCCRSYRLPSNRASGSNAAPSSGP